MIPYGRILQGLGGLATATGIGAPVGAALALAGTGVNAVQSNMADKELEEEAEEQQRIQEANKRAQQSHEEMIRQGVTKQLPNSPVFALGGSITELIGPAHEKGGIDYNQVKVEGDEVRFGDYVFSKRMLYNKNKNISFADRAKQLHKKRKEAKYNELETEQLIAELQKLALLQEQKRNEMSDKEKKKLYDENDNDELALGGFGNLGINTALMSAISYLKDPNQKSGYAGSGMYGIANSENISDVDKQLYNLQNYQNASGNTQLSNNTLQQTVSTVKNPQVRENSKFNLDLSFGLDDIKEDAMNEAKKKTYTANNIDLDNPVNGDKDSGKNWLKGEAPDNALMYNLGNLFNIGRGIAGYLRPKENVNDIDFEEFQQENQRVNLDLKSGEREIAEAQKIYDKQGYDIAQNARGTGNFLSNMLANSAAAAGTMSDIVHRINSENVDIVNQEKMFNADQAVKDSTNTLRAKIFNAEQQNRRDELEAANMGISTEAITKGLEGISNFFGTQKITENANKGTGLSLFNMLDQSTMTEGQKLNFLKTLQQLDPNGFKVDDSGNITVNDS